MIDGLSDISDKEKELMKAELPQYYICPNTNSTIVDGGLIDDHSATLELSVL